MEYKQKVQIALDLFDNKEFRWRSYGAIMKQTNFTVEEFNTFVSENSIRESETVNETLGRMFTTKEAIPAGNC